MQSNKKVAAIHDLSGVGRCSLTVIIPILSVMGIQTCPVPTAILSSHTGGFGDVVIRDLTDYIVPALGHYKSLKLDFDCIYSGFLASNGQVDHCLEFFESFPAALKVVDPVMGDHGKPYRTCTLKLCERMNELVRIADIITPNLTETAMLLNEDFSASPMTSQEVKSRLVRLSEKGPDTIVITGVILPDGTKCNAGYDKNHNSFWKVKCDYVPVNYPGSGDIFTSVLVGGILSGDSLPIAMNRATSFTELAIKTTYSYCSEPRNGIMIESCLNWLAEKMTLREYETL
ncbi:MAG: pyridoxamine kinase [Oscillospiraceae bacterium]|jgi:pyridoxine kinase